MTVTEDVRETCCPWYPGQCQGPFSEEFSIEHSGGCGHCEPLILDGPVGSKLEHGCGPSYDCLPWSADMGCDDGWAELDDALKVRATTLAWNTIRNLTAGRIASGCVTMRPCLTQADCPDCYGRVMSGSNEALLQPVLYDGSWYNWPACRPPDCSCCTICELEFPGRIAAVLEVNIDGYRHDPRLFRVDDGYKLVREDGCCWPGCQNMGAPYGHYGTFGVIYVPGVKPDVDGLWAVGILASEFAKACQGGKCRLPQAVVALTRPGVSMEFPRAMFAEGTGIREVDAYVATVNPNGLKVPPRVYSPDLVKGKHRFTTYKPTGQWP